MRHLPGTVAVALACIARSETRYRTNGSAATVRACSRYGSRRFRADDGAWWVSVLLLVYARACARVRHRTLPPCCRNINRPRHTDSRSSAGPTPNGRIAGKRNDNRSRQATFLTSPEMVQTPRWSKSIITMVTVTTPSSLYNAA